MADAPASPSTNVFRSRLQQGQRLIGCWLALGSAISTEVMGLAGFDWLLLDLEHAPNDELSIVPQLMALKDSASSVVVRPAWNDAVAIKRLLDLGASNLLVPFIESPAQAAAAVAATRYPPQGVRGVSVAHRGNRYGQDTQYFSRANEALTVAVQIESAAGVAAAAQIAAVAGVDALFVGPSDLAAALGHLGHASHPEVQAAIAAVHAAARSAGKPSGILAPQQADAERYLRLGMTMVAVGSDLGLLRGHSQRLADTFRAGIAGAASTPIQAAKELQ